MGMTKYGGFTRRRGGRTYVTHAPFTSAQGKRFEEARQAGKAASALIPLGPPAPAPKPSDRTVRRKQLFGAVASRAFGIK